MAHGANLTRQLLAAGLASELRLHIAPILLGDGRSLFGTGAKDYQLELIAGVAPPQVTHVHHRVRH
jgi:dihydrofolate reductase